VHRDLPGAAVTLRATVLASLAAASVPHGAFAAITAGSAAAAGLSVLVLAITLALNARSRSHTLARLRTMGLGMGQARSLVLAETLPQVVAAAIGGVACAWALAPLIGPSIDLSVYTGTAASVPVRPEPALLAAALAGLLVLAVITLTGQTTIASRRGFRGPE
jgi:putative ABC transport system permease protein